MNPIPLTLALAPFDRLETVELVARRIVELRADLDDERDACAAVESGRRRPRYGRPYVSELAADLDDEITALEALLALAKASAGDTILLSTHAYSLLA